MENLSLSSALNILYLLCAILVFISVLGSMLSARVGFPLLVLFLGIGMLAGEEGFGIQFRSFFFTNALGQISLAVILLDGGLRTSMHSVKLVLKPAAVLATWGVLATVGILGFFITWILNVDWRFGFLLAAIVGSTDAGAVFSILRNGGVRLNKRVQATLEIESGANDPMAILLVTGFIALNLNPESQTLSSFVVLLIEQLLLGLLMGLGSGAVMSVLLPKVHLAEGMYALLISSGGIITFAVTNLIGGSGFLAIYLAGILIGNRKTKATEHVLQVMDGLSWMAQVVLFVVLGLLVTPSNIIKIAPYALAIYIFMSLIARPIAVFSGLLPFGYRWRDMTFISWVGLRGAVPVTLAIMPVMDGVKNGHLLFDMTFALVIFSLVIQGMTLPKMSQLFKVRVPTTYEPHDTREIWVSNSVNINIFEYVVRQGSFAVGNYPEEIAQRVEMLTQNDDNEQRDGESRQVRVFACVRDGKLQTHYDSLRSGDSVWYTTLQDNHGELLAKFFNDTIIERQEQSEFFGRWVVSPNVKIADLLLLRSVEISPEERGLTVREFIYKHASVQPVIGDEISIDGHWFFIIRDTNADGELISIGLKNKK